MTQVQKIWNLWRRVKQLRTTFFGLPKAGLLRTTVHLENRTSIIRKNCQPKHCTPAFAKPLLADGVLSSVSNCTTFCLCSELSKCLPVVGCALAKKLKHRRVGRKKMNFFLGRAGTLFCKLWSGRWHVAVCKCVWLLRRVICYVYFVIVCRNNTSNS